VACGIMVIRNGIGGWGRGEVLVDIDVDSPPSFPRVEIVIKMMYVKQNCRPPLSS